MQTPVLTASFDIIVFLFVSSVLILHAQRVVSVCETPGGSCTTRVCHLPRVSCQGKTQKIRTFVIDVAVLRRNKVRNAWMSGKCAERQPNENYPNSRLQFSFCLYRKGADYIQWRSSVLQRFLSTLSSARFHLCE